MTEVEGVGYWWERDHIERVRCGGRGQGGRGLPGHWGWGRVSEVKAERETDGLLNFQGPPLVTYWPEHPMVSPQLQGPEVAGFHRGHGDCSRASGTQFAKLGVLK